MLAKTLKNYLDSRDVRYSTVTHFRAFTAPEVAHAAHIPENGMAKTVMVVMDGKLAMAVMPANRKLQLDELQHITGCHDVRLAIENEFKDCFPDCETGAMPPFGNLYDDIPVYASPELADEREITFNAGSHTEAIRMAWHDYYNLVKPRVAQFAA